MHSDSYSVPLPSDGERWVPPRPFVLSLSRHFQNCHQPFFSASSWDGGKALESLPGQASSYDPSASEIVDYRAFWKL